MNTVQSNSRTTNEEDELIRIAAEIYGQNRRAFTLGPSPYMRVFIFRAGTVRSFLDSGPYAPPFMFAGPTDKTLAISEAKDSDVVVDLLRQWSEVRMWKTEEEREQMLLSFLAMIQAASDIEAMRVGEYT